MRFIHPLPPSCYRPNTACQQPAFGRLALAVGMLAALGLVAPRSTLAAEPYIPASDDQVLVSLPRELLAARSEVAQLRERLSRNSSNALLAADVATQYMKIGNRDGDPRYYGYAQAAISTWWESTDAPAEILAIRAKLKEKDHRYDAALEDIDLLIAQEPENVQAWVERINIYRVLGKYDEALAACDHIAPFAGDDRTLLCRIPIMAVTGQAEAAASELENLLPVAEREFPAAVPWVTTMQADIARMLGDDTQAEAFYKRGLADNPSDTYLVRAYIDLLLDLKRPAEAIDLAQNQLSDNGVLLGAAIAARRAGETRLADDWQAELKNRFEEIRLRGSDPHGRFVARFLLELEQQPKQALEVALANWHKQKEQRDTQNVLEAAVAAGDPAAAQPVLDFLTKHNTRDARFAKLITKLEAL